MKKKLMFFITLLLFTLLIKSVYAISCENYLERAEQYKIGNETVFVWGSVMVGKNEYCVYEYKPTLAGLPPIVIINANNQRETSVVPQVTLSYYTGNYVRENKAMIRTELYSLYQNISYLGQLYGDKELGKVGELINYFLDKAPIKDKCIGSEPVRICIVDKLKEIVFEKKLFGSNMKKWNDIINSFFVAIGIVDVMSEGDVKYELGVVPFYENLGAIQRIVREVDNSFNTSFSTRMEGFNFAYLGNNFTEKSNGMQKLIEQRRNAKTREMDRLKQDVRIELNQLANEVGKIIRVRGNEEVIKKEYCKLRKFLFNDSLIKEEWFEKYAIEAENIKNKINATIARGEDIYSKEKEKQLSFWDLIIGFFFELKWKIWDKNIC